MRVTVAELVDLMSEILRSRGVNFSKIEYTDVRAGDIYRMYSDISRAKGLLRLDAKSDFEDGLTITVDHF